jgi:translation initiation factor 4G
MSTPKLRSSDSGNQADATPVSDSDTTEANGKKKYSRDFLLTLSQHCTDLPVGFQMSDAASALINSLAGKSYVLDREPHLEQFGIFGGRGLLLSLSKNNKKYFLYYFTAEV